MKYKKLFCWILWCFWLGLIFILSSQPGSESSELSGCFLAFIQSFISISYVSSLVVRKGAHFSLYLVLGILTFQLLKNYHFSLLKLLFFSFLFCLFYAITDEVHQLFVINRYGSIIDVCIDSAGSFWGAFLCYIVNYILNSIHKINKIT